MKIRPANHSDCDAIFRTHRDAVERLCAAHYSPVQLAMWMDGRTPAMYHGAIGQGAGGKLLEVALAAIFEGGATAAYLEATLNAVPFYQKHGFAVTGSGFFSRGGSPVRIEIVKMELRRLGNSRGESD